MNLATLLRRLLPSSATHITDRTAANYARLEDRIVYSASPIGLAVEGDVHLEFAPHDPLTDAHDFSNVGLNSPHSLLSSAAAWDPAGAAEQPFLAFDHDFELDGGEGNGLTPTDEPTQDPLLANHAQQQGNVLHREIVFIDTQTEGYEQLIDDLRVNQDGGLLEIIELDRHTDGIDQITTALRHYDDLQAIHIVSHGSDASVAIGSAFLDVTSLHAHAGDIASWGDAFHSNGDILFYGCDLAASEQGTELLESVAALTQTDVAASNDLTGHTTLGGDWILEYQSGKIETAIAFSSSIDATWMSTLSVSPDEVRVNTETTGLQVTTRNDNTRGSVSAIALASNTDAYVVTWTSASGSTGDDVYFQLFDGTGSPTNAATLVNQTVDGDQNGSSIAMDADGNFIVVWETSQPSGEGTDIYARRFDLAGNPLDGTSGDEFRVNTHAANDQYGADVAMNDAGQFVIGWSGDGPAATTGAFVRTYAANGTPTTNAEIAVNSGMASSGATLGGIAVGNDGSGNSFAIWENQDAATVEIRKFDNTGTPGTNHHVADPTTTIDVGGTPTQVDVTYEQPSIDVTEDGRVAVSATVTVDGGDQDILVARFESDLGNTVIYDPTIPANDSLAGNQSGSNVALYDDDTLLVTWSGSSDASDVNDPQGVFGKILQADYDPNSNQTSVTSIAGNNEFTLNTTIAGDQAFASVASRQPTNILATWSGNGTGDADGVFFRQLGAGTQPVPTTDQETVSEVGAITFDPIANDNDPNGDTLTLVSTDFSSLQGLAVVNGDGSITYLSNGAFDNLQNGESATDTFTYVVSDGTEFATGTVEIAIQGTNTAPTSIVSTGITVSPGSTATINASQLNATDPDHDPSEIIYTLRSNIPSPAGTFRVGGVAISRDDSFTQQDILDGAVTYQKNFSNNSDRTIEFDINDTLGAGTGLQSFQLNVGTPLQLTGTVFEDINGDSDLADAVGVEGVTVQLFLDNGDGVADSADTLIATTLTDATGLYSFDSGSGDFYIAVDAQSISPAAFNAGFTTGDVWAEQTYGSEGAIITDGSGGTVERSTGGAAYGGRDANQSDTTGNDLTDKQHITRVSVVNTDLSDVNYGFSFNVVTNTLGGDDTDRDISNNRTLQGSLRQFIQNANAISGANVMRFVPAVATNEGTWWRLDVTELLPTVTDTDTTLDGTAYNFADGQTVRNTNTQRVGNLEQVGIGTDGVNGTGDEEFLSGVAGPELELRANLADEISHGLRTAADNTTIQRFAIQGFGIMGWNSSGNIVVGDAVLAANNVTISNNLIGVAPNAASTDLDNGVGSNGSGVAMYNGSNGILQQNIIVGSGEAGIKFFAADDVIIQGNEIRRNGLFQDTADGIDVTWQTGNLTIAHNLFADNSGGGIDLVAASGGHQVMNNSIRNSGLGSSPEGFGVRVGGNDSILQYNRIEGNRDAGVLVQGQQAGGNPQSESIRNTISQNSFFDNRGIAIDLAAAFADRQAGDGIDAVNSNDDTSAGNAGLARPELTSAIANGSNFSFQTNAVWGTDTPDLEIYLATAPDPSDELGGTQFGEGQRYIATATFTGGDYAFSMPANFTFAADDRITLLAIDSDGNTSEFSNVSEIDFFPVVEDETFDAIAGTLFTGDVGTNDNDPDGSPLVFTKADPADTWLLNGDGTFSYTPPADSVSSVTFQYNATDVNGNFVVGAVTINATLPPNVEQQLVQNNVLQVDEGLSAPIATNSLQTTDPDHSAVELIYTVTTGVTHGTLELSTAPGSTVTTFTQDDIDNNRLIYRHNGTETGTDAFNFSVDDGEGTTTTGTFSLQILPVNDAPTLAVPDVQIMAENDRLFFNAANGNALSVNDIDVGTGDLEITLTATNGDLRLSRLGGLTFSVGDGRNDLTMTFQGELDRIQAAIENLRFRPNDDFSGLATIDITVNDLGNTGGNPILAADSISIEVFETPRARNDNYQLIAGTADFTSDLVANDTVPSGTTSPTIVEDVSNGQLEIHPDGSFTYTPDASFVGVDSFTYQLANGPATNEATVRFTVVPVTVVAPTTPPPTSSPSTSAPATNTEDTSPTAEATTATDLAPPPNPGSASRSTEESTNNPTNSNEVLEVSDTSDADVAIYSGQLPVSFESGGLQVSNSTTMRHQTAQMRFDPSNQMWQFATGTFQLTSPLGQFEVYAGLASRSESQFEFFKTEPGSWQVPTGLALTGGLSVGWVAWSLNSGYLLGSLLSTISPWTLVDPLPILDNFDARPDSEKKSKKRKSSPTETTDRLEQMID